MYQDQYSSDLFVPYSCILIKLLYLLLCSYLMGCFRNVPLTFCVRQYANQLFSLQFAYNVYVTKANQMIFAPSIWRFFQSISVKWTAKDFCFLHVYREDSDQPGHEPRLIWEFPVCTSNFVMNWNVCHIQASTAQSAYWCNFDEILRLAFRLLLSINKYMYFGKPL